MLPYSLGVIAAGNQRILIRRAMHRGRRFSPLLQGVTLLTPCPLGRGVVNVNAVTYGELFQLILVLISFASLIYQITKKK